MFTTICRGFIVITYVIVSITIAFRLCQAGWKMTESNEMAELKKLSI